MAGKRKSQYEKDLDRIAREHGAILSKDGDVFVLQKGRNTFRVTEATEWHAVERFLRGAGS